MQDNIHTYTYIHRLTGMWQWIPSIRLQTGSGQGILDVSRYLIIHVSITDLRVFSSKTITGSFFCLDPLSLHCSHQSKKQNKTKTLLILLCNIVKLIPHPFSKATAWVYTTQFVLWLISITFWSPCLQLCLLQFIFLQTSPSIAWMTFEITTTAIPLSSSEALLPSSSHPKTTRVPYPILPASHLISPLFTLCTKALVPWRGYTLLSHHLPWPFLSPAA